MASVYRKKGIRNYVIAYKDPTTGKRREMSARTADYKTACALAGEKERECKAVASGLVPPDHARAQAADAQPLSVHLDAYLEQKKLSGVKPETARKVRKLLDLVVDRLGARRLRDLTLESTTAALASITAAGCSTQTVCGYAKAIRGFSLWCERTGLVPSDPLRHLPPVRVTQIRFRRELTRDEVESLFRTVTDPRRALFYRLAFLAGLRRSDIARLRWCDVDLARDVIVVRGGKSRRVDEVPIHGELRPALAAAKGLPASLVVDPVPTNRTRQKDYRLADAALDAMSPELSEVAP